MYGLRPPLPTGTREGADSTCDVHAAFAASPDETVLPGAWYRNQFWFISNGTGDNLACLGIHGQMIHVSPATRTVAVELSSWPDAQHLGHLVDTLRAIGRVGARLLGDWARTPSVQIPNPELPSRRP